MPTNLDVLPPVSELSGGVSTFQPVPARDRRLSGGVDRRAARIIGLTSLAFAVVFYEPFSTLVRDWWHQPEAGHGLLLGPAAVWLAWRAGLESDSKPSVGWGAAILLAAVALRYASGLAAELFTMRLSMVIALGGLTVFYAGFRQVRRWWLPFALVCLAIPLPELIIQALALPLQFKASQMGAALLHLRDVPVALSGNIIRLPGRELFVTEACSGLRSITALLSTAVLAAAMLLRTFLGRTVLVAAAIPVAIVVNGLRVFLTGFLVYFVSPAFGDGFMHMTEGWLLFLVSLGTVGFVAWLTVICERAALHNRVADV